MHQTHLENIDLNLLKVLAAVLEEKSVTAAAMRIGLSQSATSRALGRLRNLFDDELLIRTARGGQLTPRAEAIKPELDNILGNISTILTPDDFDPSRVQTKFCIAANDYVGSVVLPRLAARLRENDFKIELDIVPNNRRAIDLMEQGEIDLAIGSFSSLPDSFFRQTLFRDSFVCLLRADHASVRKTMTQKQYLSLPHLAVSLDRENGRPVDIALRKLGLQRRIIMNIPYFFVAPTVLKTTDLMLTLPKMLARQLEGPDLKTVPFPFQLSGLNIIQTWHPRLDTSAPHRWLRNTVKQLFSSPT